MERVRDMNEPCPVAVHEDRHRHGTAVGPFDQINVVVFCQGYLDKEVWLVAADKSRVRKRHLPGSNGHRIVHIESQTSLLAWGDKLVFWRDGYGAGSLRTAVFGKQATRHRGEQSRNKDGERHSERGGESSSSGEHRGIPRCFEHLFPPDDTPGTFVDVSSSEEDEVALDGAEDWTSDTDGRHAKGTSSSVGVDLTGGRGAQKSKHRSRGELKFFKTPLAVESRAGELVRGDGRSTKDRYESKSESEEEFDEVEAHITGREVPNTGRYRSRGDGGSVGKRRRGEEQEGVGSKGEGLGASHGGGKDGAGAVSAIVSCLLDASKGSGDEDICDTDEEPDEMPRDRVRRKGGRLAEKDDVSEIKAAGGGRVDVDSKRPGTHSVMKRQNLSKSASAADVAGETQERLAGTRRGYPSEHASGVSRQDARQRDDEGVRRTLDSGSKQKARRNAPAQANEGGWITKTHLADPVSAFRGSQAATRRNRERNMKQKTLTFKPVENAGRRNRRAESSDEDIEEIL